MSKAMDLDDTRSLSIMWGIIFFLSLYITNTSCETGITVCSHNDDDLTANALQGHDESIYLIEEFTSDLNFTDDRGKRITHLTGPRKCPNIITGNEAACPIYYTLSFDLNRRPTTIVQAGCSCALCLSDKGTTNSRCSPIYYYRPVLIRASESQCFRRQVQKFIVGCQCIGSTSDPPQNEDNKPGEM